jgi:GNAT superfamily N-acetyltransferase
MSFTLRPLRPGDLGWVIERHGALYAADKGWDLRFEALVARIAADYIQELDPARENAWIAERGGERAGSVFLVEREPTVAQLRLLLVEPSARGLGIGARLVDECTRFARAAGYRTIRLWTNGTLTSAIKIYRAAGYRLVAEDPTDEYGDQTWELDLRG